jgi:hypothetical protein
MLSSSPNTEQPHTAPALRVVTAPADCASFTADQIQALDDASAAWERSGYSVALGEQYAALRRKFQYENMIRQLRGK